MRRIQRETEEQSARVKQDLKSEMQQMKIENDRKIAESEKRSKKELEESQKGFLSSVIEGVKDGAELSLSLVNGCEKGSASELFGGLGVLSTLPLTAAGGAIVGAGKGLWKVGERIIS
uniref:Uncharacterized protein n=1 Tax=Panagrolaimus sp. ES5 TaxID=591445 RepID=A0AC34GL09_9BILA